MRTTITVETLLYVSFQCSQHASPASLTPFAGWLCTLINFYGLDNHNQHRRMAILSIWNHPHFCSGSASSGAARTFFSSNILANSPFWCIETRMSHPPTNSLSIYSCGIVGQSEYSLMPTFTSHTLAFALVISCTLSDILPKENNSPT